MLSVCRVEQREGMSHGGLQFLMARTLDQGTREVKGKSPCGERHEARASALQRKESPDTQA